MTDLLAALNTGHEGGCGTVHANRAESVPARLVGLALAAGLPYDAVQVQLDAGLDAFVHCARDRDGRRRVTEIAVPAREGTRVIARPAVRFGADGRILELDGAATLAARLAGEPR